MAFNLFKNPAVRRAIYDLLKRNKNPDAYPIASLSNDYISKEILITGWYEKPFLSLLKLLLLSNNEDGEKSCVIDVGANIGNHSLFFSRFVNHVVSVEPNPICLNLMGASIEINNVDNIIVIPKAASSSESLANLKFDTKDTGSGTFNEMSSGKTKRFFEVKTDTLDNIYLEHAPKNSIVKLVKIDVEGSEIEVLKGSAELLKSHSPIIAFEAHGLDNYLSINKLLESMGYESFYKLTQSRRIYSNSFLNAVNMFARPNLLKIKKIKLPKNENYQMVIAVKEKSYGILDQLKGSFKG